MAIFNHLRLKVKGWTALLLAKPLTSYSLNGEDILLRQMFHQHKKGFYVDVGAFHPCVTSNTYLLYKRGWSGVNIDADSFKTDLFRIVRPRDVSLTAVVSDRSAAAYFYSHTGGSYGSMSGILQHEVASRAERLGRGMIARQVLTTTLAEILDSHHIRNIDFLNVDVEGAEALVLETIDFEKVSISVIAVEITGDLKTVMTSKVTNMLSSKTYSIAAWLPPTVFFVHKSFKDWENYQQA